MFLTFQGVDRKCDAGEIKATYRKLLGLKIWKSQLNESWILPDQGSGYGLDIFVHLSQEPPTLNNFIWAYLHINWVSRWSLHFRFTLCPCKVLLLLRMGCPSLNSGLLCACTRTKPIRMECARCSEFMFSVNGLVIWVHFWINLHQAICINLLWFFQVRRKQLRDFSRFKKPIPWATQILASCPQSVAVHSWVLWSRMSFQDARWISLISLGSVGCAGVTRKTSLNIMEDMEDIGRS